jgi:hypothetical protein
MLKEPYIHYIAVKINEQRHQEITGLASLCKAAGFLGLPYNDVFIKDVNMNITNEKASFVIKVLNLSLSPH